MWSASLPQTVMNNMAASFSTPFIPVWGWQHQVTAHPARADNSVTIYTCSSPVTTGWINMVIIIRVREPMRFSPYSWAQIPWRLYSVTWRLSLWWGTDRLYIPSCVASHHIFGVVHFHFYFVGLGWCPWSCWFLFDIDTALLGFVHVAALDL